MKGWLKRLRGALGMGLTWAVGWAPVGAVISGVWGFVVAGATPGANLGLWVTTMAGLGFVGGTIFSTVLRLTEGRRRFDELSLPRFAAWGALGGAALGVLAVGAGLVGAGFGSGLLIRQAVIVGATTLLAAGSAAGSLALARMANDQDLLDSGNQAASVGLSEDEARTLLRGGE